MRDLDYLKLLAKEYPTVKAASSEIINLMAVSYTHLDVYKRQVPC